MIAVLSREKQDSDKAWTMLYIGVVYLDNQPDSADYYAKALCKLSEKGPIPGPLANGLSMQAVILSKQNKQQEAIAKDMEAIAIAKKARLRIVLAHIYNNTAIIYNGIGDQSTSLDYYLKAAAIYEELNDSSSMTFIYENIASIYNDMKEYQSAYLYSLRGISLCRHMKTGEWSRYVAMPHRTLSTTSAVTICAPLPRPSLHLANNMPNNLLPALVLLREMFGCRQRDFGRNTEAYLAGFYKVSRFAQQG